MYVRNDGPPPHPENAKIQRQRLGSRRTERWNHRHQEMVPTALFRLFHPTRWLSGQQVAKWAERSRHYALPNRTSPPFTQSWQQVAALVRLVIWIVFQVAYNTMRVRPVSLMLSSLIGLGHAASIKSNAVAANRSAGYDFVGRFFFLPCRVTQTDPDPTGR